MYACQTLCLRKQGASYAQEATVGLKKSTGEQTKAPEEVPKTSDPALEAKVDKASPGKVEDFLRSQTRSEPPEDVMKGENK